MTRISIRLLAFAICEMLFLVTSSAQAQYRKQPQGCSLGQYESPYGATSSANPDWPIDNELSQDRRYFCSLFRVELAIQYIHEYGEPNAYARSDRSVLIGTKLIESEWRAADKHGVWSIFAIFAHEYAHIAQFKFRFPLEGKWRELHADYLAGWLLGHNPRFQKSNWFREMAYFFARDDYGFNNPVDHGTPREREDAFHAGFELNARDRFAPGEYAYNAGLYYLKVRGVRLQDLVESESPSKGEANANKGGAGDKGPTEPIQIRPKPQEITQELKIVARRELKALKTQIVSNTEFRISTTDKKVYYSLGEVRTNILDFSANDPYKLPFEKQVHIEALKAAFIKSAPNETFWVLPLRNAESLVDQTIQDIESAKDVAALSPILNQRKIEIDHELEGLKQNITDFANEKRFKLVRVVDTDAPAKLEVSIIIDPSGGKVRLITSAQYDLHKNILKESKDNWPWRDLLESTAKLLGNYHYLVQWSDGKCDEGDITVDSKFSRIFRPGKCN